MQADKFLCQRIAEITGRPLSVIQRIQDSFRTEDDLVTYLLSLPEGELLEENFYDQDESSYSEPLQNYEEIPDYTPNSIVVPQETSEDNQDPVVLGIQELISQYQNSISLNNEQRQTLVVMKEQLSEYIQELIRTNQESQLQEILNLSDNLDRVLERTINLPDCYKNFSSSGSDFSDDLSESSEDQRESRISLQKSVLPTSTPINLQKSDEPNSSGVKINLQKSDSFSKNEKPSSSVINLSKSPDNLVTAFSTSRDDLPLDGSEEYESDHATSTSSNEYFAMCDTKNEPEIFVQTSDEDLQQAREIVELIGERYTLDVVLCVMRHTENPDIHAIVQLLLSGINVDEWRQKDSIFIRTSLNAPKKECTICLDEFFVTEMFTLDCPSAHRFCYDCISRMVKYAINDEGVTPTCPYQENGKPCGHQLSEREVSQVCGFGELWEKYKKQLLRAGLMSMSGCVGCPTPGCENWLVVEPEPGQRIRCECQACNTSFCSTCREIYHYGCSCEDAKRIAIRWVQWSTRDRALHLEEREAKALATRQLLLKQRLEDYQKDEDWKTKNLRLCPKCQRPIEKVSGCDLMVCGRNYHGGDVQDGCGENFNWNDAPVYKSELDVAHISSLDPSKIDDDDRKYGALDHGEYILCEMCQNKIFGLRFKCIYCPYYNLCENCEPRSDHSGNHIFDIISIPEHFTQEDIEALERKREAEEFYLMPNPPPPEPEEIRVPADDVRLIETDYPPVAHYRPSKRTRIRRFLSQLARSTLS